MDENDLRVLIVDDEQSFLEIICDTLQPLGCSVDTANNAKRALELLASRFFDVVVLDVRMPDMDGLELLGKLVKERSTLQVIMLTGHGTVPMAVEAMRLGAFDFLLKPIEVDELMRSIRRAAERGKLQRKNIVLEEELKRSRGSDKIIGESEALNQVFDAIDTAALSDFPVLITGESGTGKELVARAIQAKSSRSSHPLIVVDGSTLREELIASELFGHEKGAFTGATSKKAGLFEMADRGTLFLDEIGELSPANQSTLLRVLESGSFRPLGGLKEVNVDVRVIAATNKNLKEAVAKGEFREDLYYRLKGIEIVVPPLRERKSDILLLASHFIRENGMQLTISKETALALTSFDWPGNIRQLRYVIELAALIARKDGEILPKHLPQEIRTQTVQKSQTASIPFIDEFKENPKLSQFIDKCERVYLRKLLTEHSGNKTKVAEILGVASSTLYEKLHRLGLM